MLPVSEISPSLFLNCYGFNLHKVNLLVKIPRNTSKRHFENLVVSYTSCDEESLWEKINIEMCYSYGTNVLKCVLRKLVPFGMVTLESVCL